ncbi:MAG: MlaD family protein [candidate division WOR-3 bacterium]
MNRNLRNLLTTLFVLLGTGVTLAAFFWFGGRIGTGARQVAMVRFGDVSGLRVGDPVEVLGVTKGRVAGMKLAGHCVEVRVALDKDVVLTTDTRFSIRSVSYLGSDRFVMVTPGAGPRAGSGHCFEGVNQTLDLEATFEKLDQVLAAVDPSQFADELRRTRDDLMHAISHSLTRLDKGVVLAAGNVQRLAAGIDTITALLNQESSARRLLTSSELYDEMMVTVRQLRELVSDIREHPERYFRVRLFR